MTSNINQDINDIDQDINDIYQEAESFSLHSHNWESNSNLANLLNKSDNDTRIHYEYRCKECGSIAYGSVIGPTVWATYVIRDVEQLSCDSTMIKNIIQ